MSFHVEAKQCQSQVTKGRSIALWTDCPRNSPVQVPGVTDLGAVVGAIDAGKATARRALHPSFQRGDNVQCMMNLIMPLKDKSPVGRAWSRGSSHNKDAIFAGLNNVGTVHFARFVIVGDNICMFSVYDGDFTNYIRDFIATIGSVFNAVVELVEGGEKVTPCEKNVEAFIQWVHERDLYQVPDTATDFLRDQEALNGDKAVTAVNDDLTLRFRASWCCSFAPTRTFRSAAATGPIRDFRWLRSANNSG